MTTPWSASISGGEVSMLQLLIALLMVSAQAVTSAPPVRSRPADIAFRVQMIDPGFSEASRSPTSTRTAGSTSSPPSTGTRRRPGPSTRSATSRSTAATSTTSAIFRSTSTATATPTSCQIAYFARRIVWLKNPGKSRQGLGRDGNRCGRTNRVRVPGRSEQRWQGARRSCRSLLARRTRR